jgi:tRNA(Ile)-lysidine synthetase, N-terminal domain/tRNA(Ile)-lysidine synthetase, C-terminal domain
MKLTISKTVSDFFTKHDLLNSKIIVGVSGGADSMVLLHALKANDYNLSVAHCNFQLRGNESDEDEMFVSNYCDNHQIPYFVKRFQTELFANKQGISIEMAARELRYTWFEELSKEHAANFIAIAHNQNDSIETFFLNLTRGSGIKGLQGIRPISGTIIRPLVTVSREEIVTYANTNHLNYRTDSTNLTDIYRRNFIRHNIIPLFEELNPSFASTMAQNISLLNSYQAMIENQVDAAKTNFTKKISDELHIHIAQLIKTAGWKSILFEILTEYGFTVGEVELAATLTTAQTGKRIESTTHTLWKNRDNLVVEHNHLQNSEGITLTSLEGKVDLPFKMSWESKVLAGKTLPRQSSMAIFDPNVLTFPLTLRKWRYGDTFIPSGMKGSKKISDFLTDIKVDSHRRSTIYVLESGNKIAWILGLRISEQFRKHGKTGPAIIFQMQND